MSARAPAIGITVALDPGRRWRAGFDYLYLNRSYARAVAAAGGTPVLLSPDAEPEAAVHLCQGLVISGGDDLPARFDGPRAEGERAEVPERTAWERELLDAALDRRRPLLGVCYGMQLVNLHLGGTLHTDLAEPFGDAVDHGGFGRVCQHGVALPEGSALRDLIGAEAQVSSSHHQGVDAVAPGLRVAARAPDGVIEALESDGDAHFLGVEWHPESDATGAAIYGQLVRRAREQA